MTYPAAQTPETQAQMNAWGATGIARSTPTNPLAGMGQFLGELRDLPKIPLLQTMKERSRQFRDLARSGSSEYLNAQFGWVPFIKDVQDFFRVLHTADARISKLVNGSGRNIHRKTDIINTESVTVSQLSNSFYGVPPLSIWLYNQPGRLSLTTTTIKHVYFSGCFTYYIRSGSTTVDIWVRNEQILSHLYGLRITPHLLWQLAPWSWAADWMSNMGDNIHNYSAFQNDSLLLRYGYVMCTKRVTNTYSLTGLQMANGRSINTEQTFISESRSRTRATPFGFGLNPTSFSSRQWSIIGALGISKMPRALNN